MLKGKENPNHRKFHFEYPYLATMACTENISGDITVFMGSYKFVNVIVEFYNTTREFRQFCILVIKSFDPISTQA